MQNPPHAPRAAGPEGVEFRRIVDRRGRAAVAAVAASVEPLSGPVMGLVEGAQAAFPEFAGRALNAVSGAAVPCYADGATLDPNAAPPPRESRRWKKEILFADAQVSAMMR